MNSITLLSLCCAYSYSAGEMKELFSWVFIKKKVIAITRIHIYQEDILNKNHLKWPWLVRILNTIKLRLKIEMKNFDQRFNILMAFGRKLSDCTSPIVTCYLGAAKLYYHSHNWHTCTHNDDRQWRAELWVRCVAVEALLPLEVEKGQLFRH